MFYTTYVFEILALLTGLIFYKKIRPVAYRLIVPILLLTVLNEGFAHFKMYEQWKLPKLLFYNIFFIIQVIIFSVIYYATYAERRYKNIVGGIGVIAIVTGIIFLVIHGYSRFNPYFLDAIAAGLILIACVYLYYLQAKGKINHLKKNSLFWFSSALIIGNFFLLLFVNAVFIDSFRTDPNSRKVFATLNTIGNVLYYSFIIISILCSSLSIRRAGTS